MEAILGCRGFDSGSDSVRYTGMNGIDLHCHTTASDGILTPTALVQRADRLAVHTIAITDHDTTEGVAEGLRVGTELRMEVIPGVEINTDMPGAELHVLGYFVDHTDPAFSEELRRLREGRVGRAKKMAEILTSMGAAVSFERILEVAGEGSVGRPHVAQVLLEAGHVSSYNEAFERFIGRNGPAYVDRLKFSAVQACELIRAARGLPVLAHPVHFDTHGAIRAAFDLDHLLPELMEAGLVGLEAYYRNYDAITTEYLLGTARRYGLIVTGGTDFHGPRAGMPDIGGINVPRKVIRALYEARERIHGHG